eukprot:SAG22_NODE_886_length_6665_cov_3.040359_5_plen_215_part_00
MYATPSNSAGSRSARRLLPNPHNMGSSPAISSPVSPSSGNSDETATMPTSLGDQIDDMMLSKDPRAIRQVVEAAEAAGEHQSAVTALRNKLRTLEQDAAAAGTGSGGGARPVGGSSSASASPPPPPAYSSSNRKLQRFQSAPEGPVGRKQPAKKGAGWAAARKAARRQAVVTSSFGLDSRFKESPKPSVNVSLQNIMSVIEKTASNSSDGGGGR